ncbi:MAG: hypothetical protein ACI9R3_004982 [Verrucomicrobiales bacterium]|jgi:hypothetical protein
MRRSAVTVNAAELSWFYLSFPIRIDRFREHLSTIASYSPVPAVSFASAESARLRDFSDSLSPIVVKELRQALRGGGFIGLFCCVQASLLLITLTQWWAGEQLWDDWDDAFWGACMVTMVVLIPLRSFSALSAEMRSEAFALLQLTQMSAWRIVLGKWAATQALNALVVVTTFPFFVFRYFRGGVDIVSELIQLAMIACAGAMVTAFTVAFSAHRSFLVRALLFSMIGVGVGLLGFAMMMENELMRFSAMEKCMSFVGLICLGFYALLMGAGTIASGDENYTPMKRAFAFSTIVLIAVVDLSLGWEESKEFPLEFLLVMIAILFLFDSLSETPRFGKGIVVSIMQIPVVRRFRLLRLLCYPGWQSGHLFLLPVSLLVLAGFFQVDDPSGKNIRNTYIFLLGGAGFMFPTAVIQAHPAARVKPFFGKYLFIGILTVGFALLQLAMSPFPSDLEYDLGVGAFFATVLTPISALLMGIRQWVNSGLRSSSPEQSVFLVGTSVSLLWYLVVIVKGMLISAEIRAAEAVARGERASTGASLP